MFSSISQIKHHRKIPKACRPVRSSPHSSHEPSAPLLSSPLPLDPSNPPALPNWPISYILSTMGKLIKNHWARLIVLTAASYQIAAAIEGFFWPKVFWDFLTTNLNGAVKPVPILQIINLLFGLLGVAWEWPLRWLSGTGMHRSIEARLVVYPLSSLAALLLYQGTNPGLYYVIGMGVYFWAYSEGEVGRYYEPFCASMVADAYYSRWCVPNLGRYRGEAAD